MKLTRSILLTVASPKPSPHPSSPLLTVAHFFPFFMFRDAGEAWPVVIPLDELNLPPPSIKVSFDVGYYDNSLLLDDVDDEAMELNKELMSELLDLDDIDAVYYD